jgi:hypothetical protein
MHVAYIQPLIYLGNILDVELLVLHDRAKRDHRANEAKRSAMLG